MSPCILHYAAHELWWERISDWDCQRKGIIWGAVEGSTQEWAIVCRAKEVTSSAKSTATNLILWRTMVEKYSTLGLTKPSDCLPAIAGLAARVERHKGVPNNNSLFQDDTFPLGLLWTRRSAKVERGRPPVKADVSAPSWSWAHASSSGAAIKFVDLPDAFANHDILCTWGFGDAGRMLRLRTKHLHLS